MRIRKKTVMLIFLEVVMGSLAVFWLYPYIWLTLSSIKPVDEIYTRFFPSRFTLEHFQFIFVASDRMDRDFIRALWNSIFVSTTVTFSVILTSGFVGYAVAKIRFWGSKFLKGFTIFQMLFPGFMFTIPSFVVVRNLGLIDSLAALIVPGLFGAWGVFMFSQSFKSIPTEYIEAARVEGASELWVVVRLMFPLARSTASIVGLFTFIGVWDNFLWPLMVIQDYDKMPLSVLLASFNHQYGSYVGPVLAGSVIQTIPMVLIFLLFRKYFLQGISMSLK